MINLSQCDDCTLYMCFTHMIFYILSEESSSTLSAVLWGIYIDFGHIKKECH